VVVMVMHSKTVVVRLEEEVLKQIRESAKNMGTNNSQVIRDAIRQYYNPIQSSYSQDLVKNLNDEIMDLRVQRDLLQKKADYFSLPWWARFFYRDRLLPPGR